ncbi:MAG: hypothetical protein F6K35_06795 [Okeania sp. SIO2H7]|nr:hypothetical protein [Okeania sp. SIO2H7]
MFLTNPFNNPDNWNLVWDIDITAEQATEGAFIAIERLQCPFLLSYPIVCFEVYNPHAKPYWKRAGFALQEIRTGILVGGQPETISSSKTVYLDELNFIRFNNDVDGYTLYFQPLYWHRQIILKAWEFTSEPKTTATDAIDKALADITNQLTILNTKIDTIKTIVTEIQENTN